MTNAYQISCNILHLYNRLSVVKFYHGGVRGSNLSRFIMPCSGGGGACVGEKSLDAMLLFAILSMSLVDDIARCLVACTLAADVCEDAARLNYFFLQCF